MRIDFCGRRQNFSYICEQIQVYSFKKYLIMNKYLLLLLAIVMNLTSVAQGNSSLDKRIPSLFS